MSAFTSTYFAAGVPGLGLKIKEKELINFTFFINKIQGLVQRIGIINSPS